MYTNSNKNTDTNTEINTDKNIQSRRHLHLRVQLDTQMDVSNKEQQMALSAESPKLNNAMRAMLFKKTTRGIKVFIL